MVFIQRRDNGDEGFKKHSYQGWIPPMNRWSNALLLAFLCGFATIAHSDEGERLSSFKAVFVFNFIDYVDWPDEDQSEVVKIGILGASPLEGPLREIAGKKRIGSKRINVHVFSTPADLQPCHVLLIAPDKAVELAKISQRLDSWHALTIGDTPGLAGKGAIINMVMIEEKLKFEINMQALQRAGLRASSQLLKLAILVDEEDKG
jgi:hypothetical protein